MLSESRTTAFPELPLKSFEAAGQVLLRDAGTAHASSSKFKLLFLTITLLVCPSFTALASAQDLVKFDPFRHLPKYGNAYMGAYSELFDFSLYEKNTDKRISQKKLAELKALWKMQWEKHSQKISTLKKDPALDAQFRLDRAIEKHAYFKNIDYRRVCIKKPFVFYIARPRKENEAYYQQIVDKFTPWLEAVSRQFEKEYVEPLSLKMKERHGWYGIAVLASRGDYDDYWTATASQTMIGTRAHYEPITRLAVTYEDKFSQTRDKEEEAIHSIMHELVHALQHAYFRGKKREDLPAPIWLDEGMAEFLSAPSGKTAESMKELGFHDENLGLFARTIHTEALANTCLPIADLVSCNGPGYLEVLMALSRRGVDMMDENMRNYGLTVFYAESALLIHYLERGDGGKYRKRFKNYVKRVMSGEKGVKAFRTAMAPTSISQIESGLIQYARVMCKTRFPRLKLGRTPRFGRSIPKASGPSVAKVDAPVLNTSDLRPKELDEKSLLGAAIGIAKAGDFRAAKSLLESKNEPSSRIQRAMSRLDKLKSFRVQMLKELVGKGALRIGKGKSTVSGRVISATEKDFVLRVKKEKKTFAIGVLLPGDLYRNGRRKKKFVGGRSWMQPYLKVLAGRTASKAEIAAVAETHFAADMAEIVGGGNESAKPIAALLELSNTKKPADSREARLQLKKFKKILAEHRDSAEFKAKRSALENLGRYLMWSAFDTKSPRGLGLNCDMVKLGEDRVRLTYDFSDAKSADDFQAINFRMIPSSRRDKAVSKIEKSAFKVRNGSLVGIGSCSVAIPLVWKTPMTLKLKVSSDPDGQNSFPDLRFGICEDGRGGGVGVTFFRVLEAIRTEDQYVDQQVGNDSFMVVIGDTYRFELKHDGKRFVRLLRDGATIAEVECGKVKNGRVFLWLNSKVQITIDDLVMEGQLDVPAMGNDRLIRNEDELKKLWPN